MKEQIKTLIGDISNKKLIYILATLGFILIAVSYKGGTDETVVIETKKDYCAEIEKKLEEILPEIINVGKVNVMVTAKNSGEITLAEDENNNNRQTVILNQKGGGEDAKIVKESYPEIQGVIIAADGGNSPKVKEEITEAVTALLGVDAHKIKVFERKNN